MIGDTLFLSTSYNRVVALDAIDRPRAVGVRPTRCTLTGQPPNGTGFVHRGVATWTDGRQRRVFINSRWNLIALDASTGKPIRRVRRHRLRRSHPRARRATASRSTSTITRRRRRRSSGGTSSSSATASPIDSSIPNDPPGDVQAFDVRTGRRVWSFSPTPRTAQDAGAETWKNESWKTTGHTNVWAPFSVDDMRGLVYLPVSTPSNDWYGGARKGDNLFGEALVCLDARTGKRLWYFQTVHHGLWDYDLAHRADTRHGERSMDARVTSSRWPPRPASYSYSIA